MTRWTATAYGALKIVNRDDRDSLCIVLTPPRPSEPLVVEAGVAELWERLIAGVRDSELSLAERHQVLRFRSVGIATESSADGCAQREVSVPWLSSWAHELVYALVACVAHDCDVAILFIKGPMAHRFGLRDREHSGDVDVLVRPGDETRLAAALVEWGWHPRGDLTDVPLLAHSVTLAPPRWGCEIDVHVRYPGLGLDATSAFDTLDAESITLTFAGVEARVPSRSDMAILQALHSIRPTPGRRTTQLQEAAAIDALVRAGVEVLDRSVELGAFPAMVSVLRAAFPALQIAEGDPSLPPDWKWRQARTSAGGYLLALRGVPWRRRWRVASRLLWPSPSLALHSDARAGRASRTVLEARLWRLERGARIGVAMVVGRLVYGRKRSDRSPQGMDGLTASENH